MRHRPWGSRPRRSIKTRGVRRPKMDAKPTPPTAKGETKTTDGGVKYETLKEGTGPELKPGQKAAIHYEGKLEDGEVFDSTKGKRRSGHLGQLSPVIKGWEEAIPGMKVGEIRKFTIPSAWLRQDGPSRPRFPPTPR